MGLQAIGHDKAAWDATGATTKGNKSNQVGAQVAINQGNFTIINPKDFTKQYGYVAPPGLTEGGSCFNVG